ncbi:MAG: hypothetical protein HKO02_03485 [Hyphomonadaceae bacterium]|nr:hypothetical protein [Hyphomonadaceae bacterium]
MRKLLLIPLAIFALIVGFALVSKAQNKTGGESASPAATLYADKCASCHGTSIDGGSAKSLASSDYEFAKTNTEIIQLVKDGNVEMGMPGFAATLTDAQILDIVEYAKSTPTMNKVTPATDAPRIADDALNFETWVSGLDTPWSVEFLGPDLALVTEVKGDLYQIKDGKKLDNPVENTPEVWASGQGGLLDVAIDPDFADNGWIYLGFSHPVKSGSDKAMTKIIRGKIIDDAWQNEQVLFEAKPEHYVKARTHFGNRIIFDEDGHLYFSIGDRGQMKQAQDITRPNGKIHRIMRDGSIPADNPFVDNPKAYASIFSYGNRNPQGLAYADGRIWATEHGPKGGDELNLIESGKNYGWPVISYGRNYSGTELTPYTHKPDMEQPVSQWTPSIAACGLDVVRGDLFKDWEGSLLAGALRYEELRLIKRDDGAYVDETILLKDRGRVRDVSMGPDGAIYVVMNSPGEILRITPKTKGGDTQE